MFFTGYPLMSASSFQRSQTCCRILFKGYLKLSFSKDVSVVKFLREKNCFLIFMCVWMIFFTAKNTSGSPVWSVISFLERGDHFTPRQAKLRNGKCFTSDLSNLHDWLVEFLRSAPVWPSMSVGIEGKNPPKPSMIPASMSLSVILKLGKVITPKTDFVTLTLEEFSVKVMRWLEPLQVRLSLQKEKSARGNLLQCFWGKCTVGNSGWKVCLKKDGGKLNSCH